MVLGERAENYRATVHVGRWELAQRRVSQRIFKFFIAVSNAV